MQFTNDSSRYGSVSQWLHWTTVALVIVLLVMGNAFNIEADEPGSALFFWHSSLGVLVFILAAARIGWFLFSRPPALPQSTSRLFRVLARSTHIALYALLFSLPVSGWLAASSEGSAVPIYRIKLLPGYRPYFEQAFGSGDVVTMDNASKAIGAYERTLIDRKSVV